jgi:nitronate monooxygenase
MGYRCPAEPLEHYRRKGGADDETLGRKCICTALPAATGLPQARADGPDELPVVTAGDDLTHLADFLPPGRDSYSAADVLRRLLPQES